MATAGTFSGGGLGMGVAFTLRDGFSGAANRIKKEQASLTGSTAAMSKKVNASLNMMFSGAKLAAAGGILAAPFILGISKSKEFNAAMSKVYAVSGDITQDQQTLLKGTALELGKATKFTATEAAEGMGFLAMAGLDANAQMEAMPAMLSLAAAGNTDLALTADIASDTMTAMGLAASDMTGISDQMAATITRSNTDITQMGEALKFSTAQANAMGATMPELSAMIGMLGDIGLKGSVAGTGINQMLLGINSLAGDSKKLAKLGLNKGDFLDDKGNIKSFSEFMPKLIGSVKEFGSTFGNQKQSDMLQNMFKIRGAKAFMAFTKSTSKDFKSFVDTIAGDENAAARIAEEMMNNLDGDMTKLSSILDTTLIGLGDSVESSMRPIVQGVSGMIEAFDKFQNTKVGKFILQLTFALSGFLIVLGLVKMVAGGASFAMLKLKIALEKTALSTKLLGISVIVIIGAIILISKAMKAFSGATDEQIKKAKGLQLIFLKIGGIFTGLKEVISTMTDKGFDLMPETEDKLKKLGVLDTVRTLGQYINNVRGLWLGMVKGFKKSTKALLKILSPLATWFGDMVNGVASFGEGVSDTNTKFEAFKVVGERVGSVVLGLISLFAIYKIGMAAWAVVMGTVNVVTAIWAALMTVASASVVLIVIAIAALVAGFWYLISVTEGWGKQWENLKLMFTSGIQIIKNRFLLGWASISNSFKGTMDDILLGWFKVQNVIGKMSDSKYNAEKTRIQALSKLRLAEVAKLKLAEANAVADFKKSATWEIGFKKDEQVGTAGNTATDVTQFAAQNQAKANNPVTNFVDRTVTNEKEVGAINLSVLMDGTPISKQFIKTGRINDKRGD